MNTLNHKEEVLKKALSVKGSSLLSDAFTRLLKNKASLQKSLCNSKHAVKKFIDFI